MTPVLSTDRLILRAPVATDADAIAHYLNDFDVAGNLARVPHPYYLSDAEAWLRTQHGALPPHRFNFAIELKGTGYVGHVGYQTVSRRTVLGYWLGKPFWNQGIMSEAVRASIDWFFRLSPSDTIYSGVFHFNAASLAIQTKLGFTETGRSTLLCLARGAEVAHIDTQLTRSVWKARHA
jgi:RimJ/RimL family protein N-acetyltransferase